jgi:hypothetical protein
VQFTGTCISFEETPCILMAAYLSCVYFGDLDSYFIVDCIVDGFPFHLQIQGTLNFRGKFCIPNSADRYSYQNV